MLSNLNKSDLKTVYGANLFKIANSCNIKTKDLSSNIVKQKMKYFPMPVNESWRVPIIRELTAVNAQNLILPGFSKKETDSMLVFACTN